MTEITVRSANRELMRDINRHLVLNLIKNRGPISRTDVALQSGLAVGTITNITRDLLEAGLVREVASGPSTGGRRPVLLEIRPAGGCAIGLKLMEKRLILALTDLDGNVTQSRLAPVDNPADVAGYLATIEREVHEFMASGAAEAGNLIGLGVGLPGFIDHAAGVCRHSALLGWHEVPLRDLLEKRFAVDVAVDNDVNTLTLYESLFGKGKGLGDFVMVSIGRGVGMGAFVNGRLLRGGYGGAGEFGHIPICPDGALCNCGKRGCLEALVSDPALLAKAQGLGLAVETPADLLARAQLGDPAALQIYREAGAWLGRGLATLVNILNPSHVMLSGEGAAAAGFLLPAARAALVEHAFAGLAERTDVSAEPLADESWARGAASLALDELFSSPFHAAQ